MNQSLRGDCLSYEGMWIFHEDGGCQWFGVPWYFDKDGRMPFDVQQKYDIAKELIDNATRH